MATEKYNLTKGNIAFKLIFVSLPVIAASLMQMAYNLTDLFWLGRATADGAINRGFVASVGLAGFFTWLGAAVFLLIKIGVEVRVSQSIGRDDEDSARIYARTGVQLELIFAVIFTLVIGIFAKFWMSFFNVQSVVVYNNAVMYLQIISIGMIFYLMNPVFSASLNGTGKTKVPFFISGIGLALNMVLDPLFINIFHWNISGAAYATVISQIIVSIIFIIYFYSHHSLLSKAHYFKPIDIVKAKDLLRLGFPVAIQNALFCFISMFIARIVSQYGDAANATQRIGSQIESLSWLTAGGFQTAIGAFVGQNFGANQPKRVLRGVRYTLISMVSYGVVISILMYVFAGPAFGFFLKDSDSLPLGIDYLHILAFSQLFMIVEAIVSGALNGLGKTIPESINSLALNILRIPMAYIFIYQFNLGLNGVWLSITISSILKGIVIYVYYIIYIKRNSVFKHIKLSTKEI